MIDPAAAALHAVATRSASAFALVALAGVVTGVGPCAAPRSLALVAATQCARRPARTVAAFVAGTVCASVACGALAGAAGLLWSASHAMYALAAVVLALAGIVTIARAGGSRCGPHDPSRPASTGGPFLLGAATSLLASPCCTPVLAGIAALTLAGGRASDGVPLLAAFACGHAAPAVAAACAGARSAAALRAFVWAQAPSIVTGTLMLALALYYGVLA